MLKAMPPAAVPIFFSDLLVSVLALFKPEDCRGNFCREISDYFGIKYCFLLSSGRAALSVLFTAMCNLRGGSQNEIALPAYTSFSVPSAAVNAGLRVRLYDIDPDTLSPVRSSLASAINNRTLAVTVCHLYGYPCDMDMVNEVAKDTRAYIIDDAAQTMGAKFRGKYLGTFGDAGIFSLGRGKNITALDGGIIVTNSEDIALAVKAVMPGTGGRSKELRLLALIVLMSLLSRPRLYWIPRRMPFMHLGASVFSPEFRIEALSRVQAVLGSRMLKRLHSINESRRKKAALLQAGLKGCTKIKFPRPVNGAEPVYLRLPVQCNGGSNLEAVESGIVRSYPYPLNEIPEFQKYLLSRKSFSGAQKISDQTWTVPTHEYLSGQDISQIIDRLSVK